MDDLAVGRDADRPRGFDHPVYVFFSDLVVGPRDRNHAHGVLGPEVGTCEETTTDSMRWPAIRSAVTAAAWMAAIVLSRFTTTPLRKPSEGFHPRR